MEILEIDNDPTVVLISFTARLHRMNVAVAELSEHYASLCAVHGRPFGNERIDAQIVIAKALYDLEKKKSERDALAAHIAKVA